MEFHNHQSMWDRMKGVRREWALRSVDDAYAIAVERAKGALPGRGNPEAEQLVNEWCVNALISERNWFTQCRPYYKVWPSVIGGLCRINLDLTLSQLALPGLIIVIRFPKGGEPSSECHLLESLFTASIPGYGFIALVNGSTGGSQWTGIRALSDETHISEFVRASGDIPAGLEETAFKIAISCHLLANDPSIIQPDVLAADRDKFDATGDPKYIEKAKRRGIIGWRIGEAYEACPHYRRPHFALRHTGKGRTVPRIVAVKGSVVHRSKIEKVPTGYITPDGMEVEP